MRPADAYQGVGESLQADVMRFMAIIAFCLIAILALVRSVEPPPAATAKTPLEAPRGTAAVPPERADGGKPVPATPVPLSPLSGERTPTPEAAAAEPAPRREPARVAEPASDPQPAGIPEPASDPQTADIPESASDPQPTDEGLSLRFASERDFLRLVNQGGIELYAFNDDGRVLSVSADFRLHPAARAPGRLHELLPSTIPELMTAALEAREDGSYRWGIDMPERMARRVRELVERGASGELVIDRDGEVRHHER